MFRFDPATHKYFLSGKEILGLTESLHSLGFYEYLDSANQNDVAHARDRGKAAHKAVELFNAGRLDESKLHDEIKGYVESWKQFVSLNRVTILHSEKPIYSKTWLFGCTPDMVVFINGKIGVLEVKASDYLSATYQLQTQGQKIAVKEFHGLDCQKRFVFRLSKTGRGKLEEYKDPLDKERFIFMLRTAQFKKERC